MEIPLSLPSLPTEYPDYSSLDYWNQRHALKIKQLENRLLAESKGDGHSVPESQKNPKLKQQLFQEDWYLTYNDLKPYILKIDNL